VNKDHIGSGFGVGVSPPQASTGAEIGDQGFRARDRTRSWLPPASRLVSLGTSCPRLHHGSSERWSAL